MFDGLYSNDSIIGEYTLGFSYNNVTQSIPVFVQPGTPAGFYFLVQPPNSTDNLVDWDPQPSLQVCDAQGNAVSLSGGSIIQVQIVFDPSPFSSGGTVATANANGVVSFTNLLINGVRGQEYTITFSKTIATAFALSPITATISISPCPSSEVNDDVGDQCVCAPGYEESQQDLSLCSLCTLGSFKPFSGSTLCTYCPSNMVTLATGALSLSQCLCESGMYYVEASSSCQPCLAGGTCSVGANLSTIEPMPGYYRFSENSSTFYPCSDTDACPGGNETCAVGYKGPLCSVCQPGYGGSDDCLRMPPPPPLFLSVFFYHGLYSW